MKDVDFEKYQLFFWWKPLDVVRKTFEATPQWAATTFSAPMKRHYKSRFPTLNHPRLNEMLSHVVWINTSFGGYTCAQLYYGVKSKYIALYPMTTESQGSDTLEDLCRNRGAHINIMNDRAQMERGKTRTAICHKYNIE